MQEVLCGFVRSGFWKGVAVCRGILWRLLWYVSSFITFISSRLLSNDLMPCGLNMKCVTQSRA